MAYQPRRFATSPLYRLLQDHWESFIGVYEEEYQHTIGALRSVTERVVEKFLDCIFGGLTPDRSGLLFDLALHTRPVPKAITYEMYEFQSGIMQKGWEVIRIPRDTNTILIERQVGVFVPGWEIRSIANWLMAKADEWEGQAELEQAR